MVRALPTRSFTALSERNIMEVEGNRVKSGDPNPKEQGACSGVEGQCSTYMLRVIPSRLPHDEPEKVAPLQCGWCGKRFFSRTGLGRHAWLTHERARGQGAPALFRCGACGRSFNAAALRLHLHDHAGERRFACGLCDRRFTLRSAALLHARGAHPLAHPHRCRICTRAFPALRDLQAHRREHRGRRPFPCARCGRGFDSPGHLDRHMAAHDSIPPHPCPHCSSGFTRKYVLEKHLRRQHRRHEFRCQACGEVFPGKKALKVHTASQHAPPDVLSAAKAHM